jgi:hypothetical protein
VAYGEKRKEQKRKEHKTKQRPTKQTNNILKKKIESPFREKKIEAIFCATM